VICKDKEKSCVERIVGIWDVDIGNVTGAKCEQLLIKLIQPDVRVELVDK